MPRSARLTGLLLAGLLLPLGPAGAQQAPSGTPTPGSADGSAPKPAGAAEGAGAGVSDGEGVPVGVLPGGVDCAKHHCRMNAA